MGPIRWDDFGEIWSVDFEFATTGGTGVVPHTFVAHDIRTGRQVRLSGEALRTTRRAPIDVRSCMTLAYNIGAEAQCFEALGWEQPWWPVDPYAEHLALTNGLDARDVFDKCKDEHHIGYRLIDALRFYGREVGVEDECRKREMQLLGAKGEPYSAEQWAALADYCADDTIKLADLFGAMRAEIDLPAALIRGRYMIAIGQQVHRGIPIDGDAIACFKAGRAALRQQFIDETPGAAAFYPGGRLSERRFVEWAASEGIGLPHHPDGSPVLEQDTLGRVAKLDRRLAPFVALRSTLSKLEEFRIAEYADGRIRPNYMPLRTRTGRNKPRAGEYPMLQARWLRGFVLAPPGRMLAQVDFKAQEIYIAAALAEDRRLLVDLEADPYLSFAVRSGFAPAGATKQTHNTIREMFKPAMLGIIYGMGEWTLARRLGIDVATAREIRARSRSRLCPSAIAGWGSPQASGDGIGRPACFARKHAAR